MFQHLETSEVGNFCAWEEEVVRKILLKKSIMWNFYLRPDPEFFRNLKSSD